MKKMIYILATLMLLFAVSQIWAKIQNAKIETLAYLVLKEYDGFEIRRYEPATFSYVTLDVDSYDKGASMGFSKLGGYIFGANENQSKISMTSPVEMEMDSQVVVKFMVPSDYKLQDLPIPTNKEVKFVEEPARMVAAIQFGGFANDEKIKSYKEKLFKSLDEQNIKHVQEFSFFGYNSPYDLINRRNEVIVEVDMEGLQM
jgi:hypothetical protein